MAKRVAQMGNIDEKLDEYTGIAKQITVSTENFRPRIMDGVTAGGHKIAMLSDFGSYLSKTDAANTYLGKTAKAESAKTADAVAWANVSGKPSVATKSGDQGALTSFATAANATAAVTINDNANKSYFIPSGLAVTVANGTAGKSWEAKAHIATEATVITLGTAWKWVGKGVVKANSILVLSWCQSIGYASIQSAAE